jgi:hypothetical protein
MAYWGWGICRFVAFLFLPFDPNTVSSLYTCIAHLVDSWRRWTTVKTTHQQNNPIFAQETTIRGRDQSRNKKNPKTDKKKERKKKHAPFTGLVSYALQTKKKGGDKLADKIFLMLS